MSEGSTVERSDQLMRAIGRNVKEMRILETSLNKLHLEKSYSMSLLKLDSKEMQSYHRRLRQRVDRIKSYLTASDVRRFKKMDDDGKLLPVIYQHHVNNSLRISAAAYRLKVNEYSRTETKSQKSKRAITKKKRRPSIPSSIPVISEDTTLELPAKLTVVNKRPATAAEQSLKPSEKGHKRSETTLGFSSHTRIQEERKDAQKRPLKSRREPKLLSTAVSDAFTDNILDGRETFMKKREQRKRLIKSEERKNIGTQEDIKRFINKLEAYRRENVELDEEEFISLISDNDRFPRRSSDGKQVKTMNLEELIKNRDSLSDETKRKLIDYYIELKDCNYRGKNEQLLNIFQEPV
ncbi:unnamed protein product [Dimorphilus gyrociliatus]|uniref:Uncharacterized protein n=1 Tax=Dimorphilus gyrociliatus TaxID=2664684 RepID=A0A7I8W768_9ANNE|nr:unnamed protein product [Dimorphilus gyrociliatus]